MKVERVSGGSVEEVGGLRQLRPQGVELDVRGLELPVVALRQTSVLPPDGVIHRVMTNGLLHVPS